MHPSHHIASRLHHEAIAVVRHPCRHVYADRRPLVAGALSISVHHQAAVVEPYLALGKARLAKSRPRVDSVSCLAVHDESRPHIIQIAIAPRPEMHIAQPPLSSQHSRVASGNDSLRARERSHSLAIIVRYLNLKLDLGRSVRRVDDLRLYMSCHPLAVDVIVGTVDIHTRSAEIAV